VASAIFLLPVSAYALDLASQASLVAFLQAIAPAIMSLDSYGLV